MEPEWDGGGQGWSGQCVASYPKPQALMGFPDLFFPSDTCGPLDNTILKRGYARELPGRLQMQAPGPTFEFSVGGSPGVLEVS